MNNKIKNYIAEEQVTDEELRLITYYCKIRYDSNISQRELANLTGLYNLL